VATARERVVSFLYGELERVAAGDDPDVDTEEARPEREGRVSGVLGALRAVGLLGVDEADAWRPRLMAAGVERPVPPEATRRAAGELLQDLLEAVPPQDEGSGDHLLRFEGAFDALLAVGAASGEWYERRARRMGSPPADELDELYAGGTERDLRAVLAGPGEAVGDMRVLCALLFDDGVSVLLRVEDGNGPFRKSPVDFELCDDVGTSYSLSGAGGGGRTMKISYGTPAPADATWLELRRAGSRPTRIPL
jgi:hypothetical protein